MESIHFVDTADRIINLGAVTIAQKQEDALVLTFLDQRQSLTLNGPEADSVWKRLKKLCVGATYKT
jgi:hypothetical protein